VKSNKFGKRRDLWEQKLAGKAMWKRFGGKLPTTCGKVEWKTFLCGDFHRFSQEVFNRLWVIPQ